MSLVYIILASTKINHKLMHWWVDLIASIPSTNGTILYWHRRTTIRKVSEFSLKVYCCYWAKLSCSLLRGNFVFTCTESRRWNCIEGSQSFIIVLKALSGHLWCIYMWLTCILWCYILLLQPLIKRNELIMPFTMFNVVVLWCARACRCPNVSGQKDILCAVLS